jgi:hypothetical protein
MPNKTVSIVSLELLNILNKINNKTDIITILLNFVFIKSSLFDIIVLGCDIHD